VRVERRERKYAARACAGRRSALHAGAVVRSGAVAWAAAGWHVGWQGMLALMQLMHELRTDAAARCFAVHRPQPDKAGVCKVRQAEAG